MGLIFNGVHSDAFDLTMVSADRQLLPTFTKASLKIPGKNGQRNYDDSYDNRFLTVEFGFEFDSLDDLQIRKRQIAKWLSGSGAIIFDDEPDKQYTGRVYNQISFSQDIAGIAKFTVIYETEPLATGETINISKTITQSGDETAIQYDGNYGTGQVITIKNAGATTIHGIRILIEQ